VSIFTPALLRTHSFVFFAVHETRRIFLILSSERRQDVFLHSFLKSSFHSRMLLQVTLALSLVVFSLKSVCCDFSIFSAVMPWSPALCLTWYGIPSYTHHLCVIRDPRYGNVSTCSSSSFGISIRHAMPLPYRWNMMYLIARFYFVVHCSMNAEITNERRLC